MYEYLLRRWMMLVSQLSGAALIRAEEFVPDIRNTVCITGHREKGVIPYRGNRIYWNITKEAVKCMLGTYIDMALEKGYRSFFSGLAEGADLWAAEHILRKKKRDGSIRLIGAMPFLDHAAGFSEESIKLLEKAERGADELVLINDDPDASYSKINSVYRDRNYFMVENSSVTLAFLNDDASARRTGTMQTVNYSNRRGRRVYQFGISDIHRIIDKTGPDIRAVRAEIQRMDNIFDLPF